MSRARKLKADVERTDLEDLIPRRSAIQLFLLELDKFGRGKLTTQNSIAFQGLVGAGFALWRAVFLTRRARTPKETHTQAQAFLRTLIADNAIAYPQERSCLAWTSGFYLNNAYFRLHFLYELLDMTTSHRKAVEAFIRLQGTDRTKAEIGFPLGAHWETAMSAAQEILKHVQHPARLV